MKDMSLRYKSCSFLAVYGITPVYFYVNINKRNSYISQILSFLLKAAVLKIIAIIVLHANHINKIIIIVHFNSAIIKQYSKAFYEFIKK